MVSSNGKENIMYFARSMQRKNLEKIPIGMSLLQTTKTITIKILNE